MKKLLVILLLSVCGMQASSEKIVEFAPYLELRLAQKIGSVKGNALYELISAQPQTLQSLVAAIHKQNLDVRGKMEAVYALTEKKGARTVLLDALGITFSK